ncbi:MAG: preprotein translocase subunit SecA [Patescibacteria group bacterium]
MFDFLKKISGGRSVARYNERAREINALEPEVKKFTDEELRAASLAFKEHIQSKEKTIDDILPNAFAFAREAARRTLGQRPFDVQLVGGMVLHDGAVSEMMTGEGKTLTAVLPAYLNALTGEGVHVVTVNEYLARRDVAWMGQIYRALGLSVACLVPNAAYLYDPTYVRGPRGQDADLAEEKLLHEDLTYRIRGILFSIKNVLGLGHKENIYQKAIESELLKAEIVFEREKAIDVLYDGKKIGTYQPDFVIDGKVILEIKAVPFIGKIEEKQVWSYLKGSPYRLALLANFGGKDIEIKRIVYDTARDNGPRESASSQRESALLDKERDSTGNFLVQQEFLRPVSRREAYLADITYGTNHEFGFDYLRDNLAYGLTDQVQRGHHYGIIDEVDSILIDEARTPLIIAAPDAQSSEYYKTFARVVTHLKKDEDYTVDEKLRSSAITEAGIEKVEKVVGIHNLYAPENMRLVHYLEESLRAMALFHRDKDYVVKDGEVIIVDEFTGRMLHGRRYNAGLHQAIEAKEGVLVKEESRTYAKISIQNYFRMYKKIAGMTGTAQTSAEEFHKVYSLEVVSVPTNQPMARKNLPDFIFRNKEAKLRSVVAEVKQRFEKGQPILLGTPSIEKNDFLSAHLTRAGIPHEVLNAKNNEREGAIVAQAGRLKAVTVATNVAGRGVDIILGGNPLNPEEAKKVRDLGGLHVIGTERNEARRIDNQFRGRAGRQGDPGSSQFLLSLDDDLLRIFGGDRIKSLMERFDLPEDQPIEMGIVSKAVEQAQAKVEGANFDMRKHLLEYDDVLNKQRASIYRKRQEILQSMNRDTLALIIFEAASGYFDGVAQKLFGDEETFTGENTDELKKLFEESVIATKEQPLPKEPTRESIRELLTKRSVEVTVDPQTLNRVLSILDLLWMTHLEDLEALSESIGLRAYGQRDPLVEYRREAHNLFKNFWGNFNTWIFTNLFKLASLQAASGVATANPSPRPAMVVAGNQPSSGKTVGRNDPCPCGSGKKYKKCHGS